MYKTEAKDKGFNFIELPKEINLGTPVYEGIYSKVTITLNDGESKIKISAITYGFGITKYGINDSAVKDYILFVYSEIGRQILEKHGFNLLEPSFESKVNVRWLNGITQQS